MRTIEAARRVTKTEENCDDIPHLDRAIARLFEIDSIEYNPKWGNWSGEYPERARLKGYWINKWLCTDTHVGEMAYFLDDELVFTCEQTARKNDAFLYFVDQAAYDKVKVFIDQYRLPDELDAPEFIGDQESPDEITYQWAESCLRRVGMYQGREVKVGHIPYDIRRDLQLPGSDGACFYSLFPYVYIYDNDVRSIVNINELTFGLFIDGK